MKFGLMLLARWQFRKGILKESQYICFSQLRNNESINAESLQVMNLKEVCKPKHVLDSIQVKAVTSISINALNFTSVYKV